MEQMVSVLKQSCGVGRSGDSFGEYKPADVLSLEAPLRRSGIVPVEAASRAERAVEAVGDETNAGQEDVPGGAQKNVNLQGVVRWWCLLRRAQR
jgi:hypothetical protein